MLAAPCIELRVPLAARARYLISAYRDVVEDRTALEQTLLRLPGRHGRKRLAEWLDLVRSRQFEMLAQALMQDHYDPAYQRSRREDQRQRLGVVAIEDLDPANQDAAAVRIAELVAGEQTPTM